MDKIVTFDEIKKNAEDLAEHILKNRKALHYILRKFENYDVVEDEINKSADVLKNITDLKKYFKGRVNLITTFLPLNIPLYSFVLFAVIPSYQAKSVTLRVPAAISTLFGEVYKVLSAENDILKNISLYEGKRKDFVEDYCKKSDVIIFTGKYQNFSDIRYACKKDTLMIFNGSGHNPVIVTESANLKQAVEKIIKAKLYNNGQDCIAPNIIFVHSKIAKFFIALLSDELDKLKVDINYSNDNTEVGPLMDRKSLIFFSEMVSNFLNKGAEIVYGGKIDFRYNLAYPCVFSSSINNFLNYEELYSPIFVIDEYVDDEDLKIYFEDKDGNYNSKQMYVSVFGHSKYVKNLNKSTILIDKTALDIEEGNKEFGGYSLESSAVCYMGKSVAKPILIPREIFDYLLKNQYA